MPFFVEEEIICVNDSDPPQGNPPYVIKGRHYTVSRTTTRVWYGEELQFVFVAELPAPEGIGWFAARFRKLVKKKAEQEVSTEVRAKTPEKVQ